MLRVDAESCCTTIQNGHHIQIHTFAQTQTFCAKRPQPLVPLVLRPDVTCACDGVDLIFDVLILICGDRHDFTFKFYSSPCPPDLGI